MTVLCGHTHSAGEAQVLPNLRVLTGGAEYGRPELQRVLAVDRAGARRACSTRRRPSPVCHS